MLASYKAFEAKLASTDLEHHERQILEAHLDMLKELMVDKTRDVRRRLRESKKYS